MSFLDRFQNKISTVTAHGHLKNADGSEEIRVGVNKSRYKRPPIATTTGKNVVAQQNIKYKAHDPNSLSNTSQKRDKSHFINSHQTAASSNIIYKTLGGKETENRYVNDIHVKSTSQRSPQMNTYVQLQSRTTEIQINGSPRMQHSHNDIQENEENHQDSLAYSRKARPVQYEPCNLAQYRKEKPSTYYELGTLKPDLNTDELIQKRAIKERIKTFSQNLRKINLAKQEVGSPTQSKTNRIAQDKNELSAREKALQFAKNIPKPKVHRNNLSQATHTSPQIPINNSSDNQSESDDDAELEILNSKLQELKLKHEASRAQVNALLRGS